MGKVYDGIIGLATGDAPGVPAEFRSRQELTENPVVSIRGYGTHHQPVGTWSDDTRWCLLNSTSYRECVLKAVNPGNDTDTVGTVAGGLAGMYYGAGEIPDEWLNTLKKGNI